jgi:group I intron endonuclease
MLKPYGYIYKTINLINQKIYIGQKTGAANTQYLGSGKILKRAIKKYGKTNFKTEIIAYVKDKDELNKLEKYYINEYRKLNKASVYNISEGGTGGRVWGENHPMKGTHLSQERKDRLKLLFTGRKQAEETIAKKRIAFAGEKNPMFGRYHTQKTKAMIAERLAKYKGEKSWNFAKPKSETAKRKSSITKKRNYALGKTVPWCKDTKGVCKPNSGSFKKGMVPWIKGRKLGIVNRDAKGRFSKKGPKI